MLDSPRLTNAGTLTGDGSFLFLRLYLPSLKWKSDDCDSRNRCMSAQVSYAAGATETGIEFTSPNGSSLHGA